MLEGSHPAATPEWYASRLSSMSNARREHIMAAWTINVHAEMLPVLYGKPGHDITDGCRDVTQGRGGRLRTSQLMGPFVAKVALLAVNRRKAGGSGPDCCIIGAAESSHWSGP